jgi:hypothetical protein
MQSIHVGMFSYSFLYPEQGTGPTLLLRFASTHPMLPLHFATTSQAQSIKTDRILWRAPPVSAAQVTGGELQ